MEQTYSSTLPLTSALGGRWWSKPRPGYFTPGKDARYPFYRSLHRPQCRSWRARKILPSPGFDRQTVQVVASPCTDWSIPAHSYIYNWLYLCKVCSIWSLVICTQFRNALTVLRRDEIINGDIQWFSRNRCRDERCCFQPWRQREHMEINLQRFFTRKRLNILFPPWLMCSVWNGVAGPIP
jgi:hypothetical protein